MSKLFKGEMKAGIYAKVSLEEVGKKNEVTQKQACLKN